MITDKNYKETKWFKVPKLMLVSDDFQKLNIYAKAWLLNLFSLNNTYKGDEFYQSMESIQKFTGMSAYQIRMAKKDLLKFGVKIYRKGNDVYFSVGDIYRKYVENDRLY